MDREMEQIPVCREAGREGEGVGEGRGWEGNKEQINTTKKRSFTSYSKPNYES